MISTVSQIGEQYAWALDRYLRDGGESLLHAAYELGRKAVAEGVGILEMASIHNNAVAAIHGGNGVGHRSERIAELCGAFLCESLAPFEMVLRGVRESNSALRTKIAEVQAAERELHIQNQDMIAIQHSLHAERRRYQELFNFAPDCYLVTDLKGTIQEANRSAAAIFQVEENALVGKSLLDFIPEEERGYVNSQLAALNSGALERLNLWHISLRSPGGNSVTVAVTAGVIRDSSSRVAGLRCLLRDITDQQQIQQQRAELRVREHLLRAQAEVTRRLKFLADASTMLADSLDYRSIPQRLASAAVPYLADCCMVFIIDGADSVESFAVSHSDQQVGSSLCRLAFERRPPQEPIRNVLQTQNSEIAIQISDDWLRAFSGSRENFTLLQAAGLRSVLLVPLVARGRALGAIAFFSAVAARQYSPDDWALADELSRRAALILENARLYHEVVLAKEKAESASKAREEFVAILSHELRTPLMTVLGWSQVLKRETQKSATPIINEAIQSLEHNAHSIARLVEDCLDVARVAEGKIQLRSEILDLNRIAATAVESVRSFAEAKQLRLHARFSEPLTVLGDPTRLEEVVLNLLTNAVKYTEPNGAIEVMLERRDAKAALKVTDTGIGIAPEFLEQIFEPFRQGTSNWYATESGLGLGLAIAREIVQMHGGRVWAESAGSALGSAFHMELPLAADHGQTNSEDGARPRVIRTQRQLQVLLIEDSRDVLNLMRLELERLGYQVHVAMDGKTGLEIAQRELPDVIVSDIKMPGFDGYDLITAVRKIPALATTPAVALTGFGMQTDIDRALVSGYTAHLCKPADIEDLAALIDSLVS